MAALFGRGGADPGGGVLNRLRLGPVSGDRVGDMDKLRGWLDIVGSWLDRARMERELDEELRFHLDRETEKLMAEGLAPAEARRQARIRLGGMDRTKEAVRDEVRPRPLEDLVQDIRFAIRTLASTPIVVVVTVVSLGIGIGAVTGVFSIGNAFLFPAPGPVASADALLTVYTSTADGRVYGETSFQDYLSVEESARSLDGVAAFRVGILEAGERGSRDRVLAELVTGNYFTVLGVRPALGRFFAADETGVGTAERVLVLSQRGWQERFGGARDVVGRELRLDGQPFTVVGVAPKGLVGRYLRLDVDGWIPLGIPGGTYHATPRELADRNDRDYQVFGRLRSGVSVEQAGAELSLLAERLREAYPDAWGQGGRGERSFTVHAGADGGLPPDGRTAMAAAATLLLAGALLLLILVCANVGGMLLARAGRRSRELAVRASLGASRGRLVRLLLTESVLLAGVGGALGVYVAYQVGRFLRAIPLPFDVVIRFDVQLDHRVLLFAVAVSVLAAVAAGLVPALRASRTDLQAAMKLDPGAVGPVGRRGRRSRLRSLLVGLQVAVATAIVVGAGLAYRSLDAGLRTDPGLDLDGLAIAWASAPDSVTGQAAVRHFLDLAARVSADPAVERVALARTAEVHPFMEGASELRLDLPDAPLVEYNAVTPGYLEMVGLAVEQGRGLRDTDGPGAPPVALVNRAFLRRYLPNGGPGDVIRVAGWLDIGDDTDRPPTSLEIVGVVRDRPRLGAPPRPAVWTSFLQDEPVRAILHARARGDGGAAVPVLRDAIGPTRDEVTLVAPTRYVDAVDMRFAIHRFGARIAAVAGLFALGLALLGLYGAVSFSVSQRFREMAIRQAMGANPRRVLRSLVGGTVRTTALGMIAGLAITLGLAQLARTQMFGVSPLDPITVGGAVTAIAVATILASLAPARRLLQATPMDVLRDE